MDARPTPQVVSLTLAVRATPLTLLTHPERVAASAGLTELALDCSVPFAITSHTRTTLHPLRVNSLWLGSNWLRTGASDDRNPLILLHAALAPRFTVVDLDGAEPFSDGTQGVFRQLTRARAKLGADSTVLLRLRGSWLAGGRRHLADLTALRHILEEWDFGFALDLSQSFDPSWEAEAAVIRLGNRLRLLRLSTAATDRHAIRQDRVAARALATALDQTRPPTLALVPAVPFVLRASRRAQVDTIERAATAIAQHHIRMRTERSHYLSRGKGPNVRS